MLSKIIYEDDDVVAVSKPSDQVVIPGRGDLPGEPLIRELETHFKNKLFVVHRLDRGASGLVIFAKNADAHKHFCKQFEGRSVLKHYLVLAQGKVEAAGHIDQPLRAFGSGRIGVHADGKASTTDYSVHEALRESTLLDVMPHTGRRHQIRVHLYSISHPVMGDTLYGKDRPVGGAPRLMLHAWTLSLESPSGAPLILQADPPPSFTDYIEICR